MAMSQYKPSQVELYGEILSSEQLHRKECAQVDGLLSDEERAALIERMRAGDATAKEALFFSMLRFVRAVAWDMSFRYRWIMRRDERMDVMQVGYEAILEKWEEAFSTGKDNPVSFLLAYAKYAMQKYCLGYQTEIVTPSDGAHSALRVESLDVPQRIPGGESGDVMLADMLSEPEPVSPSKYATEEMSERLRSIVERVLTPRQVYILACLFGLWIHAPQGVSELAATEGLDHATVCSYRERALERLRKLMTSPDDPCEVYTGDEARQRLGVSERNFKNLVQRGAVPASKWGLYPKQIIDDLAQQRQARKAGEQQKHERVQAVLSELVERGEPVTVKGLARLAGVSLPMARAYVHQYQASVPVSA
jgi:DNA-directed RNA polymerase specialized sigma24 family protein